jgi:nickel-dependent lactate racemase
MNIRLQYGKDGLDVEVPSSRVTVLRPRFVPGLPDEGSGFREAVRSPVGCRPLRELVRAGDRVAVVVPDVTRPFPSRRVLPWLLEELSHVPREDFTVVVGGGTHRACTDRELEGMLGRQVMDAVEVDRGYYGALRISGEPEPDRIDYTVRDNPKYQQFA